MYLRDMKKIISIVALTAAASLSLTGCQNLAQSDATCKVTDKDRSTATDKNGHSKSVFRVYTEGPSECTTFGLGDNIITGNFNASDMYGKIERGHTYKFHLAGVRNGALNLFPEIQRVDEVK